MNDDSGNPYKAPNSGYTLKGPRRRNWVVATILGAAIGLGTPYIVMFMFGTTSGDRLSERVSGVAYGLSYVFACAAFLNYYPRKSLGLLRSVALVGIFSIIGVFVAATCAEVLGLGARTYSSDPWRWLRATIALSVPTFYVVAQVMYLNRFFRSDDERRIKTTWLVENDTESKE